jgi:hypothetical protein
MKNNVRKSLVPPLLVCVIAGLCISKKSECSLNVTQGRVPHEVTGDASHRGCCINNNVLMCEQRRYINWFFPFVAPIGSECFWDVYKRKFQDPISGGSNLDILMGRAGSFPEQKDLLASYVRGTMAYLGTVTRFYPQDCRWLNCKNEAIGYSPKDSDRYKQY